LEHPKVESPLRYRTTEENPDTECDHHLTPGGVQVAKKRRMEDSFAANKRKIVHSMDAAFDETLMLWIEHGKITVDQLEEWIARKQTATADRETMDNTDVQIEFTTPTPSTASQIQGTKTDSTQDDITSNWGGNIKSESCLNGHSSSTSSEGNAQACIN